MLHPINPGLFLFEGQGNGSNAFLLKGERNVLIDASDEANSKFLVESLKELSLKPEEISHILFTHGHADHFSGAKPFKNAEMMMHEFDAKRVNAKDAEFAASSMLGTKFFPKISSLLVPGQKLSLGKFELEVLHTPGHTAGSVSFLERKLSILFSGDLLFKTGVGRFDLPSGSKEDLLKSVKSLQNIDFELLLPGHGPVSATAKDSVEQALKALSGPFI